MKIWMIFNMLKENKIYICKYHKKKTLLTYLLYIRMGDHFKGKVRSGSLNKSKATEHTYEKERAGAGGQRDSCPKKQELWNWIQV